MSTICPALAVPGLPARGDQPSARARPRRRGGFPSSDGVGPVTVGIVARRLTALPGPPSEFQQAALEAAGPPLLSGWKTCTAQMPPPMPRRPATAAASVWRASTVAAVGSRTAGSPWNSSQGPGRKPRPGRPTRTCTAPIFHAAMALDPAAHRGRTAACAAEAEAYHPAKTACRVPRRAQSPGQPPSAIHGSRVVAWTEADGAHSPRMESTPTIRAARRVGKQVGRPVEAPLRPEGRRRLKPCPCPRPGGACMTSTPARGHPPCAVAELFVWCQT